MSELKSYKLFHRASALTSPEFLSVVEFGKGDEVYLKSEADKVIAELEESHKMEVEQLLMEVVKLKGDYKEACDRLHTAGLIKDEQLAATRHQKYKRCLAMAKWCENKLGTVVKPGWWDKWRRCWLELAEKLKEAK